MSSLHLTKKQRLYLSEKFNALNKNDVQNLIQNLLSNIPHDSQSAANWFGLFHEASCAISETQTLLELNLSLDFNNKSHEKKLKEFEENILSCLLSARAKLMDIYIHSPFKKAMYSN